MGPAVTFVLGKPPERTPVIAAVIAALAAEGVPLQTVVPSRGEGIPADIAEQHLIVQRGLTPEHLGWLMPWAPQCCNDPWASAAVLDRHGTMAELVAPGLPVPATDLVDDYDVVRTLTTGHVIKSLDATTGRGAAVLLPGEPLPRQAPFAGPFLVQQFITGWEAKLYVFGDEVRGVARPAGHRGPGTAFHPEESHTALARAVGTNLGLEVFGVDVMVAGDRGYVVDVNPFPAAAKVTGSAELITAHLRRRMVSAPPEPAT